MLIKCFLVQNNSACFAISILFSLTSLGAAALKVINSASHLSPQSHNDNIKLKSKENTKELCTLNY